MLVMSMRDALLQPDLPYAMQLELTSTCNLRCAMCPLTTGTSSTSASPGHVTEETWERVLPVARRCQQVFIAGYGEPFTNARCVELLRDLDTHGVATTIATNGLIMTGRLAADDEVHAVGVALGADGGDDRRQRCHAQQRRGPGEVVVVHDAVQVVVRHTESGEQAREVDQRRDVLLHDDRRDRELVRSQRGNEVRHALQRTVEAGTAEGAVDVRIR